MAGGAIQEQPPHPLLPSWSWGGNTDPFATMDITTDTGGRQTGLLVLEREGNLPQKRNVPLRNLTNACNHAIVENCQPWLTRCLQVKSREVSLWGASLMYRRRR